jgi:CRP-like cAMP-binding protein
MSLSDKITLILQKPIHLRKKEEVNVLISYFKDVAFFKDKFDFSSKNFKDTVNAVTTKEFKKGENVFEYGDKGEGFYVVLEGTVSI